MSDIGYSLICSFLIQNEQAHKTHCLTEEECCNRHGKNSCCLRGGGLSEKSLESTTCCLEPYLFHSHKTPALPHLVVDDHHITAVCTQPGVHGLADAADFVQGGSVVVRPAKVQHLRDHREQQSE